MPSPLQPERQRPRYCATVRPGVHPAQRGASAYARAVLRLRCLRRMTWHISSSHFVFDSIRSPSL
jgi:hypothetical protein